MASVNGEDPFLQVQSDVLSALQQTRPLFSSYLRIRSLATSPSSPELVQARTELQSTLQEVSADLRDLVDSVQAVEHDPYRFGLDIDEVSRRRRLVNEVGGEIESMRKELQETVHSGSALPNPADFDNVHNEGVDDYTEFEQQRQMEMMHEQDEQLDGVFKTVGNLRQQADDMGRELEEQAVMIDEVDTLADRVGGKLQNGVKRVGHIIRKNEDWPHNRHIYKGFPAQRTDLKQTYRRPLQALAFMTRTMSVPHGKKILMALYREVSIATDTGAKLIHLSNTHNERELSDARRSGPVLSRSVLLERRLLGENINNLPAKKRNLFVETSCSGSDGVGEAPYCPKKTRPKTVRQCDWVSMFDVTVSVAMCTYDGSRQFRKRKLR
ncbi:MAG: hypothetical protein Q9160_001862 [Pyrenula sp. 1 TL-2023]